MVNGRPAVATVNPDGSILADTRLHIERFTDGGSVCADPVRERAGIALLDVVVSLAILGLSGTALITLLGQTASQRATRTIRREGDATGIR